MIEDELELVLTHPNVMYGSEDLLNPNVMCRPRKYQEMQIVCDDKTANAAVHLDPGH